MSDKKIFVILVLFVLFVLFGCTPQAELSIFHEDIVPETLSNQPANSSLLEEHPESENTQDQNQAHHHIYGENYIQEIFSYEQFGPMKSENGGKTWTKLAENLPSPFRNPFDGDVSIHNFEQMIVRPFLFGQEFPSDTSQKSFYSVDGGRSFTETPVYINIGRYDPHDEEGNHLLGYAPWYAEGDLVESFDARATWKTIG